MCLKIETKGVEPHLAKKQKTVHQSACAIAQWERSSEAKNTMAGTKASVDKGHLSSLLQPKQHSYNYFFLHNKYGRHCLFITMWKVT